MLQLNVFFEILETTYWEQTVLYSYVGYVLGKSIQLVSNRSHYQFELFN